MQISKEYLKKQQYQNANNLTVRRDFFQHGTNPEPLWQWVAKQYAVNPKSKILEVGCGTGDFWQEASKVFPKDCAITLTDFSAGMLKETKKNLTGILDCQYEVADVEQLPYTSASFDIVFAHLMLYHTHSPEQALTEIKRVLKPAGFVGILLSGANNMQALFDLLNCENPRQATRFSAEIASKTLPNYFTDVKKYIYHSSLKISEVEPLIAYIHSLSRMNEKSANFYSHCRKILAEYIEQNGAIILSTSRHLFIAS
jgi:ubiquinone/menaquinone biosynthesis C-methylase UbiE